MRLAGIVEPRFPAALGRFVLALAAALGGLPCAIGAPTHLVAVLVTVPSTADERTVRMGQDLEGLLKSRLGNLPGIGVVSQPRGASPGAPISVEDWVRSQKAAFLVKADVLPGSDGKEWAASSWLADLRKSRDQPMSQWPKLRGSPARLTEEERYEAMERIVADIRKRLETLAPRARRSKSVLVTCFVVTAGEASPKAGQLPGITTRLSIGLPSLLNAMWKENGNTDYDGIALQPTEVERLCDKLQDPERLAAHKQQADYVIEGVIWMASAQEVAVQFSVYRHGHRRPLGSFEVVCELHETSARVAASIDRSLLAVVEGD